LCRCRRGAGGRPRRREFFLFMFLYRFVFCYTRKTCACVLRDESMLCRWVRADHFFQTHDWLTKSWFSPRILFFSVGAVPRAIPSRSLHSLSHHGELVPPQAPQRRQRPFPRRQRRKKKQARAIDRISTPSFPPQANPYLLAYNTVLAAGWAYVLYLTFATVAAGGWTKEVLKVRKKRANFFPFGCGATRQAVLAWCVGFAAVPKERDAKKINKKKLFLHSPSTFRSRLCRPRPSPRSRTRCWASSSRPFSRRVSGGGWLGGGCEE
jgi:hypothetical protein